MQRLQLDMYFYSSSFVFFFKNYMCMFHFFEFLFLLNLVKLTKMFQNEAATVCPTVTSFLAPPKWRLFGCFLIFWYHKEGWNESPCTATFSRVHTPISNTFLGVEYTRPNENINYEIVCRAARDSGSNWSLRCTAVCSFDILNNPMRKRLLLSPLYMRKPWHKEV